MSVVAARSTRWLYPVLCFFITFLGGTLYAYSIIGYELQRLWNLTATEAGIPYFASLAAYGYLMFLGGVLERRFGSEKVPLYLGALMLGLGLTFAGFVEGDIALFSALYFVAGLGVALMDSMTLPIATSWVPERPGLAVGIARAGFGLAPLVVAPLLEYLFKVYGFSNSLKAVGLAYLATALLIAYLVKMNPSTRRAGGSGDVGKALAEILHKRCFWVVWVLYFSGLFAPLAFIGYVKQIGVELASVSPDSMGFAIAVFSLFNALGRVLYGKVVDSRGFTFTATLNYVSVALALTTLWLYPSQVTFLTLSPVIYLGLGGWLVIAPAEVRVIASPERYSLSWPLLMTSYATAVFTGTLAAGFVRDALGGFQTLFPISIAVALAGGLAVECTAYRMSCRKPRRG